MPSFKGSAYMNIINQCLVENKDVRNGVTYSAIHKYFMIPAVKGSCEPKALRRALNVGVETGAFLEGSTPARWKATDETKKLAKENSSPKVWFVQR